MQLSLIRIPFFFFLLLLIAPSLLYADTERRTALVIGNGDYNFGRLKNSVNDANDIREALKKLGFRVTMKKNAGRREMIEAINHFGDTLKDGGVGLFFYAGHAVQVDGNNYLIPINANVSDKDDIEHEAVDLNRILKKINIAKNNMNIVILDACRDNPFPSISRSMSRGLAIIPTTPTGTIISYATAAGQTASDGEGRNSPYTTALLKHIQEPGLSIEQVFKKVRNSLAMLTGGKQVPAEYTNLNGDFYFTPAKGNLSPANQVANNEDSAPTKMKKIKVIKTPGHWENTTSAIGTEVKTWIPPEYETRMVPDKQQ